MLYVVMYRVANFIRWVAILDKINNEQIIYTDSSKSYWVCLYKWKSHYCLKPTSICSYSLVLLAERRNNKNNFYYLWFDKTGARTHDIGRANRQVKSAQVKSVKGQIVPSQIAPKNIIKKNVCYIEKEMHIADIDYNHSFKRIWFVLIVFNFVVLCCLLIW